MKAMAVSFSDHGSAPTSSVSDAYTASLEPLLRAFRWRGNSRQVAEAIGTRACVDLIDLRNAMANLDFVSNTQAVRLKDIDPRLLPCLFVPVAGNPLVILQAGIAPGTFLCFDGSTGETATVDESEREGTACFFTLDDGQNARPTKQDGHWLRAILRRFENNFLWLLGLSFVLSLLALFPAFFVQAVYDRVLATHERLTLGVLVVGILFALLCDTLLRIVRGAALAHVGARLDFLIGSSAIRKLLSLPLARLENSTVGVHLGRLREFEALRTVFAGPMAIALLELPFMFVFVIAIAAIAGWLALVPVGLALVIAVFGFVAVRYANATIGRAIVNQGDHQGLLVEILANMRAIKAGAAETIWLERARERSAAVALVNLKHARIAALTETVAHAINQVAGATTLAIGAAFALDGSLSIGALIASMTLVWRMLAPLQALFVTLTRFAETRSAVRGIDQLMALPSEGHADWVRPAAVRGRRFDGRISFQRVVLRYVPHHEPAIAGISFDIKPGQIVAVTGGNGCGKSSVLKLIAGIYPPQMGAVLIDGVDTRQLNPIDLRQSIAYLPQQSDIFSGTLADNLRLSCPTATDLELRGAATRAGLLGEIEALPDGFATAANGRLSTGFARKLALARTFLMDASIVLLDEPGVLPDRAGDDLLLRQLDALRGRSTVLLVTHHPDHVRAADRVIVLNHGTIVHDGTPQELMGKLAGGTR